MKNNRPLLLSLLCLAMTLGLFGPAGQAKSNMPKLVVVIIVDQLPADRARQLGERSGGEGFRQIYSRGVVYENALYNYAASSTAPGHASIATGTTPSKHGIVSNFWFNPQTMRPTTSTTDRKSFLLGLDELKRGATPVQLMAPTLADRLIESNHGLSKVFSFSLKDRGAIFTAGRNGKAFWYSSELGKFVTSNYYFDEHALPEWLADYNNGMYEDFPSSWDLLLNAEEYQLHQQDDRHYERPPKDMDRVFPHHFAEKGSRRYFQHIRNSPYGDIMTLDLAKIVIEKEALGKDDHPDLLSVSLSSSDYIGHTFGPYSLEAEDNSYRLDRLLSEFMDYLEQRLDRRDFLLVLTSDHGIRPIPESLQGVSADTTRIYPLRLTRGLNRYLKEHLKIRDNLVQRIIPPNVYFDTPTIKKHELDAGAVYGMAADWLQRQPAIAKALPVSRLPDCLDVELCRLVQNNIYPGRSGEIYLIQTETAIFSLEPPVYAANHGSPYKRDRHVPVIFYGMGYPPKSIDRPIQPSAIAPTIVELLDLEPLPQGSKPLIELTE